ncbi:TetR/AcrR family transcriptional regulator [Niallia circulans]|nr:TetR/AcrR family transcriptional regulator [Niallia circulans]
MSPRKAGRQELTRDSIVYKARELFIEKGYQELSMRSIAKELECSHGAIYYHFKNKAALFHAIVDEGFFALNKRIEEILGEEQEQDKQKQQRLMLSFLEFGLNNQSQYEMMFMQGRKGMGGLSREAANHCYEQFTIAIQTHSKSLLKASAIMSAFISLHGFISHYHGSVKGYEEVKNSAEDHVEFIIKGLENEAKF